MERRGLLQATAAFGWATAWLPALLAADPAPEVMQALRRGGVAVMLRHAHAPGTFDPPGFRLADCTTQRNLDAAGCEQAKRIGAWFESRGLRPAAVRSSPWCRCLDTARLAFGADPQPWAALGSTRRGSDRAAQLAELRAGLARLRPGGFEVWVSHQFTLQLLAADRAVASGEGLVLGSGGAGEALRLVGSIAPV